MAGALMAKLKDLAVQSSELLDSIVDHSLVSLKSLRATASLTLSFRDTSRRERRLMCEFALNPTLRKISEIFTVHVENAGHFSLLWQALITLLSNLVESSELRKSSVTSKTLYASRDASQHFLFRHLQTSMAFTNSFVKAAENIFDSASLSRLRWNYLSLAHMVSASSFQAQLNAILHIALERSAFALDIQGSRKFNGIAYLATLEDAKAAVTQCYLNWYNLEVAATSSKGSLRRLIVEEKVRLRMSLRGMEACLVDGCVG